MNKIINAVIGDPKNASPTKKYAAYALLGTVAAFALALVILIGSSIAFAVADGGNVEAAPSGDASGDDAGVSAVNTGKISYVAITADELDAKIENELVDVQEKRTAMEGESTKKYYDAYKGQQLVSSAQKALDSMLIAYYNATQDNDIYIGAKGCGNALYDSGWVVGIANSDKQSYLDATPIDKTNHKWIFDNAYLYGFVQISATNEEQAHVFRYVGVAIANYINSTKSVSDYAAFINAIKINTKGTISTTVSDGKVKTNYQMYYLSADAEELKVPTNYEYTVMADDTNGYIVIVNMSKKVETAQTTGGLG